MKHFFVSYTNADRAWAEWIAWQLEGAGYSTVIQAWDFRPGSNFVAEMHAGLIAAERVMAILSPHYLASRFGAMEWQAALADKSADKLLPVRIEAYDVEGLLRGIVYTSSARTKQKSGEPAIRPYRFPGALPSIWNVPFLRNPHFTGRDDLLAQLRTALAAGQAAALTQPQVIHGLGVGKTQLAVEYAYRHASEYDIVWWVRADSPALIAGDLALLAQPLQLTERDERDQNVVVQAVRRELAQRANAGMDKPRPYLLIFDNAEEPKDVRPFLPQGGGHILITSRNPTWGALAHPLDVQVLPREQAIEFLLKRTGLPPLSQTGWDGGGGDLADALGCLPLALEQAGAFIEARGIAMAEYLRRFRKHARQLSDKSPATDCPATVEATWRILFNAIAA